MHDSSQHRHGALGKRSHLEPSTLQPNLPTYYGDKGAHATKSPLLRRLTMLGRVKVSTLISTVVLIAIIFFVFRYVSGGGYGLSRFQSHHGGEHKMSEKDITKYLDSMVDTRPSQCEQEFASEDLEGQISIILDYKDEQFYDLKLTLDSIMRHTAEVLIKEIILLDDGSEKAHIIEHAARYLKYKKFGKLSAYSSAENEGQAAARFKAAKVAKGSVLVFLSSRVVVNKGWLEPLLSTIFLNSGVIAVPHHDSFLPGYRFFGTDNNLINTFTWTLSTVYAETEQKASDAQTLKTPVMRGDIFAITKDLYVALGSYDETLTRGGGHDLEFSFRAWMCGAEIRVALCSRVAVHSAMAPLQVDSEANFQKIIELWLDDQYQDLAYYQSGYSQQTPDPIKKHVKLRTDYYRGPLALKCKPFEWYLNRQASFLVVPSTYVKYFGKLKVSKTLYCPKSVGEYTTNVEMVLCRPHMYDAAMMFELDKSGFIRTGDRCMTVGEDERVYLKLCRATNAEQQWELQDSGRLTATSRGGNKCATQVSERDVNQVLIHYMAMQDCSQENERKQLWSFINY